MRLLAITVGGEPAPVIRAIEEGKPDYVIFFASISPGGGSARMLEERTDKGPPIPKRTGLTTEQYEIVKLRNHDDLDACFDQMVQAMEEATQKLSYAMKTANYTGGTKSMAAALVLAAIHLNWQLELVTGPRDNLHKVTPGTESLISTMLSSVRLHQVEPQAEILFNAHDYAALEEVLGQTLRNLALPGAQKQRIAKLRALARSFKLWDNFQYSQALSIMRPVAELCPDLITKLAMVTGDVPGYELVSDMLGNAMRRAHKGLYDDAIIRLYRAVELLAQLHLMKKYGLNTSKLDLNKIPNPLRSEIAQHSRGKYVAAGLIDSYRILTALNDPLGELFSGGWDKRLLDLLRLRNRSLLTHGLQPITREDWEKAQDIVMNFMQKAAEKLDIRLTPVNFPTWNEITQRT